MEKLHSIAQQFSEGAGGEQEAEKKLRDERVRKELAMKAREEEQAEKDKKRRKKEKILLVAEENLALMRNKEEKEKKEYTEMMEFSKNLISQDADHNQAEEEKVKRRKEREMTNLAHLRVQIANKRERNSNSALNLSPRFDLIYLFILSPSNFPFLLYLLINREVALNHDILSQANQDSSFNTRIQQKLDQVSYFSHF